MVIYNGIDVAEINRQAERAAAAGQRWRSAPGTVLLVVPGRICREKGQDVFLRALAESARQLPQLRAVLAGDTRIDRSNEFLSTLKDLAASLGVTDRVIFPGFVEDVAALYAAADVVVLPSLAEPFGRVVIEAMALSKPVIACRSGGVPEVVVDGETGRLVPSGDAPALARAMVAMGRDPDVRRTFGANGRRRVEGEFRIEQTVTLLQDLYDSVTAQRRVAGRATWGGGFAEGNG